MSGLCCSCDRDGPQVSCYMLPKMLIPFFVTCKICPDLLKNDFELTGKEQVYNLEQRSQKYQLESDDYSSDEYFSTKEKGLQFLKKCVKK